MKKILFTMVVAATLFAGYSAYNVHSSNELTGVVLTNIEALASEGDSPCISTTNGYKNWKTSSIWGGKKEFYDCCSILREGYSPSGNCN